MLYEQEKRRFSFCQLQCQSFLYLQMLNNICYCFCNWFDFIDEDHRFHGHQRINRTNVPYKFIRYEGGGYKKENVKEKERRLSSMLCKTRGWIMTDTNPLVFYLIYLYALLLLGVGQTVHCIHCTSPCENNVLQCHITWDLA